MTQGTALPRDLGAGLVLRHATADDIEALAAFNAGLHMDLGMPGEGTAIWTRDMLRGDHPTMRPSDALLVVDTKTDTIVSSLCLISQRWTYSGIPFGVGRVELVGTTPEFRRRGLVRAQFDAVHAMSAARGEHVQGITGIPWYYRQFGYEMALELEAARVIYHPNIPRLADGTDEPFRLQPATEADIPFIARCYDGGMHRDRVACQRDEALWRYELSGVTPGNDNRQELHVITAPDGQAIGFLSNYAKLWLGGLYIKLYELAPGISWLAVSPSVLRYAEATGAAYAKESGRPFDTINLELGQEHPLYQVFRKSYPIDRPYAWYLRVPDLPGFFRQIAPALEARLADSILVGHTGALTLNFYRSGVRLAFTNGRLTDISPWQPESDVRGDAAFPDLNFLQLLFGYKSLDELHEALPDCVIHNDAAYALLTVLFPKQSSNVWPIA